MSNKNIEVTIKTDKEHFMTADEAFQLTTQSSETTIELYKKIGLKKIMEAAQAGNLTATIAYSGNVGLYTRRTVKEFFQDLGYSVEEGKSCFDLLFISWD